jgi:cytosine/adenosine deaminase-related metal-dependent hydrolase
MRSRSHLSYAAHAPYTASIEMAQACRRLADEAGQPLSVHLAVTASEIDFLMEGHSDEIEELLRRAQAFDEGWQGAGRSPVRYYVEHGILTPRTYAIHVNYPQPGDIELLSQARPTVVFCPSTHAYFGHPRHAVVEYLQAGIPVALGTDSLASNAELSPLREAALLRRDYPEVSAEDVFAALTSRALAPLGWDRFLGRLEPGYLADFAVFTLEDDPLAAVASNGSSPALHGDAFGLLLDAVIRTGRSSLTVANGRVVHEEVPQTVAV